MPNAALLWTCVFVRAVEGYVEVVIGPEIAVGLAIYVNCLIVELFINQCQSYPRDELSRIEKIEGRGWCTIEEEEAVDQIAELRWKA